MSTTLILYRCAPNQERRAAKELRDAKIRACVPRDRNTKRKATAPGYVGAKAIYSAAFAQHIRGKPIGHVSKEEFARLYIARARQTAKARPFAAGDHVTITAGPFAQLSGIVRQDRGRVYRVDIQLFGSWTPGTVHESHMRKHDPG